MCNTVISLGSHLHSLSSAAVIGGGAMIAAGGDPADPAAAEAADLGGTLNEYRRLAGRIGGSWG